VAADNQSSGEGHGGTDENSTTQGDPLLTPHCRASSGKTDAEQCITSTDDRNGLEADVQRRPRNACH
jgi:hypothetical protein